MATEIKPRRAAALRPNKAHSHASRLGVVNICGHPSSTPGRVGEHGEPFVSSAVHRPTPIPTGTAATLRAITSDRLIQ
jgi:hypothetical protein